MEGCSGGLRYIRTSLLYVSVRCQTKIDSEVGDFVLRGWTRPGPGRTHSRRILVSSLRTTVNKEGGLDSKVEIVGPLWFSVRFEGLSRSLTLETGLRSYFDWI